MKVQGGCKNHGESGDYQGADAASALRSGKYRSVFVGDYELFLKNESQGLPRLNKVARDILFRYCTFSRKYRDILATNPQYQPLMDRWNVRQGTRAHLLDVFTRKIQTMTDILPPEVEAENVFLNM